MNINVKDKLVINSLKCKIIINEKTFNEQGKNFGESLEYRV